MYNHGMRACVECGHTHNAPTRARLLAICQPLKIVELAHWSLFTFPGVTPSEMFKSTNVCRGIDRLGWLIFIDPHDSKFSSFMLAGSVVMCLRVEVEDVPTESSAASVNLRANRAFVFRVLPHVSH